MVFALNTEAAADNGPPFSFPAKHQLRLEVVYQDEKSHYKEAAKEAATAVRTKRDLVRMKKAVTEVSLQRVYMRNEMFKESLTDAEIKSCVASHSRRAVSVR